MPPRTPSPPPSLPSLRARSFLAGVLASAALHLGPAIALADTVEGTRSEALVEKEHRIALRLDRGHAELVVQRTVHNGGPRHDQAVFMLDLPQGAVATGLASLGLKNGQPFWFRGDLMEAEAAAEKYRELTGIGGFYPKDPALLSWRSQDTLALQVFPCAPGQPKTVEYTLRMPTAYREGRHHLTLPRVGTETLAATVVVSAARPGDRLFLDGKSISPGTTFQLAQDETDLALAPRPSLALDGAFSSSPLGSGRELVALRIDAPARLAEPPRNARVVVLLDASRSLHESEGAAALAAARAYLAHLDGSLVEVLTFDREVHARHGRFVPAARALADLDKLVLHRKNGSRIDDALARADALLAATPAGLPRRILALTDLHTRSALTPARLGAVLKSGAVVHVGLPSPGSPDLARDDEHPFAVPVRATGGLVWTANASERPEEAADMRRVYEEWVRPLRIDHLDVRLPGLDPSELGFDEQLPEGEGLEFRGLHEAPVAEVVLTGELWARPVRRVFTPDQSHGRLWSALVFGTELLDSLTEPEMTVLAFRGGAVSPVTSYLAIEPGVRPSTEGLDWSGSGMGFGSGSGRLYGSAIGRGASDGFDRPGFLRAALGQAFARCPAGPASARVTLETTVDEVVDVPSVTLAGSDDAAAAPVRRCLEDAAWDLDLPGAFRQTFARYEVELSR
ncbi:hypothetical protein [Sorangium sp. So ce131]|uniref:hypothetical protein n=1 Tax=Sorangium sp. So ce131 TaxID=3133282 RepID=UPI003F63E119